MRVLVNALSVRNLSGRHVLLGHLRQLARLTQGRHEYVVLHHPGNADMVQDLGGNLRWLEAPGATAGPVGRAVWERGPLRRLATAEAANIYFTPDGTTVPGLRLPQVSFAQNPWPLVPGLARSLAERAKCALLRGAYRRAMREAACMVFNSAYMREAYRENAGFAERRSLVVHQAIDDETHRAAAEARGIAKSAGTILCVSVMAPHKNVETLVRAMAEPPLMRQGARLHLVGPWASRRYEARIRALVAQLGLGKLVDFEGFLPLPELRRRYAETRVFCLMSRCESFGIPAVEAQAFGTPVVSSDCCAIPEICGRGGVYQEPMDVAAVASALEALLRDDGRWAELSALARENADRFRWERCSPGLLGMFEAEG